MDDSEHDSSVISEDMWRAWAERGRRRHESAARQRRIRAATVLLLVTLIGLVYFLAVR
jgi:hypothetical protein